MDMNWIDGWLNNCMMWMFALLEELVRNLRVTCHGGNYMWYGWVCRDVVQFSCCGCLMLLVC